MYTEPIVIPGVAGPVVVTVPTVWGRPVITVGGRVAPRIHRRRYALPARSGGTVEAVLRTGFADPYPSLEVNGTLVRTGPKAPVALRALALLPLLLLPIGGALGGLAGGCGFVANLAVARTGLASTVKALTMVGVAACAFVAWLVVAVALRSAT